MDRRDSPLRTDHGSDEWYNGTEITYTNHYYGIAGPKGINPSSGQPYAMIPTILHGGISRQGLFTMETIVKLRHIPDGTSNTLLLGERNVNVAKLGDYSQWDENNGFVDGYDWDTIRFGYQKPAPDRFDTSYYDTRFGSSHPGGFNVVLGDGSVRLINYNITFETFRRLCVRDDGLTVDTSEF